MKTIPKFFNFQKEVYDKVRNLDKFALFMEQGTGKSKIGVQKAYDLFTQGHIDCVVVICPESMKYEWISEHFNGHFPLEEFNSIIWDNDKSKRFNSSFASKVKEDFSKLLVFSVNVEAFQYDAITLYIKTLLMYRKVFVIVDESVKIKNGRRRKRGPRKGAKRTNAVLDLFEAVPYKAILTGTPLTKSPIDLWSQFEFLQKDFFKLDYYPFKNTYGISMKIRGLGGRSVDTLLSEKKFHEIKSKIDPDSVPIEDVHRKIYALSLSSGVSYENILYILRQKEFSAYKNLNLLRDSIAPFTSFIKKADVLDLPDKIYRKLSVALNKTQTYMYEELSSIDETEYEGDFLSVETSMIRALRLQMISSGIFPYEAIPIEEYAGLDQEEVNQRLNKFSYKLILPNSKLTALMEDIETLGTDSVIIWGQWHAEIEMIYEELKKAGYSAVTFYKSDGYENIEKFKSGEAQFLVASIFKGAEGLNLQISNKQYFFSNPYRADTRLQAEARSHRIGQSSSVTYTDIVAIGTSDQKILDILKSRESLIDYFRSSGEPRD